MVIALFSRPRIVVGLRSRWSSTKAPDPLRILFFGADDFSCKSLQRLHDEHRQNPGLIESIDVFTQPDKPFGRGRRMLREGMAQSRSTALGPDRAALTWHPALVPLRGYARSIGLPLHAEHGDVFKREWEVCYLPSPGQRQHRGPNTSQLPPGRDINLIIAVSFGLLIPARLIEAVKYGGLNVHPSLLPE